jgi:hypothetical protein
MGGVARSVLGMALTLWAFNVATTSLATAQGTAGVPDSEREYRQKIDSMFTLLNSMNHRQIRQDRILGFGFGVTLVLLVGLGIVILSRRSSVAVRDNVAQSEAGRTIPHVREAGATWIGRAIPQVNELGCAWLERLAKLRLDVHHANFAKRQKGIRVLLSEMESYMANDLETNQRFRAALDNLSRVTERLEADTRGTPKDQGTSKSS